MRILTLAYFGLLLAATPPYAYAETCPDGTQPPCRNRVVVLPFTAERFRDLG